MADYVRVRNSDTGHEYDKLATTRLRDNETVIPYRRIPGRWCPPKFRVDKAGKPAPPRKSPAATADGQVAAVPADNEKE